MAGGTEPDQREQRPRWKQTECVSQDNNNKRVQNDNLEKTGEDSERRKETDNSSTGTNEEKGSESEILRHDENSDNSLINSNSDLSNASVDFCNVNERYNTINFMYTNARSLPPKIISLIEMFDELELHFAAVSETWMYEGARLEKNGDKLEEGEDLKIIKKCRNTRGGGVAIVFNKHKMSLKPVKIRGNRFELVAGIGRTVDNNRKILVLSAYYPPQMKKEEVEALNE